MGTQQPRMSAPSNLSLILRVRDAEDKEALKELIRRADGGAYAWFTGQKKILGLFRASYEKLRWELSADEQLKLIEMLPQTRNQSVLDYLVKISTTHGNCTSGEAESQGIHSDNYQHLPVFQVKGELFELFNEGLRKNSSASYGLCTGGPEDWTFRSKRAQEAYDRILNACNSLRRILNNPEPKKLTSTVDPNTPYRDEHGMER